MYLHPLIHTELSRQRQRELSRLPRGGERGSRSLPGKQAAATLGVLLVAVVAALGLTSGALAATAKKPSHPSGTAPKGASWKVTQDASGKITIRIGGRIVYVYYPAPAQPLISSNTDTNDDCVNYQLNCTDEQNCQYWGVCSPITDTPAANQDSSAGDSTNDAAAQADNASLEPQAEVVSNSSADQAANDTATSLADPYSDEDC